MNSPGRHGWDAVPRCLVCVLLPGLLILVACQRLQDTPGDTAAGEVAAGEVAADENEVGDDAPGLAVVEAKAHLLPGNHGAIYLQVQNGGAADRLVAVETGLAEQAELHETFEENGVMRMRPRDDGFVVPAGGTLALEPGGKHVMLLGVVPAENDTVPLTLHFAEAGVVQTAMRVLASPGTESHGDHGDMDHGDMDHGDTDHGEMQHGEMQHGALPDGGTDP